MGQSLHVILCMPESVYKYLYWDHDTGIVFEEVVSFKGKFEVKFTIGDMKLLMMPYIDSVSNSMKVYKEFDLELYILICTWHVWQLNIALFSCTATLLKNWASAVLMVMLMTGCRY